MPLIRSKSKKAVSANIRELVHSYRKTGKIGRSKPKDIAKARRQAIAIALNMKKGK